MQALTFYECTNLEVKHLRIENGQQIHVSIESCRDVEVSRIVVNAPEKSPNTDGIHVADTQDIMISNCIIATGICSCNFDSIYILIFFIIC